MSERMFSADRLTVIIELLEALQVMPTELNEVKAIVSRLEKDSQLCYSVLKTQGWLLKKQQTRLKKLETIG